jgi:2'-5' RNA ligase
MKTMFNEGLYFIALIPNRELREKIIAIEKDFESRFNSRKALAVYPHITLKAPFKCSAGGRNELLTWFADLVIHQRPFLINLKGFGAFHNKKSPVVFINPVITEELLKMQRELVTGFSSIFPGDVHPVDLKFTPHLTVAYRDLAPDKFLQAWGEYENRSFNDVFDVNAIYLLQHDTKKWNVIATHDLKNVIAP